MHTIARDTQHRALPEELPEDLEPARGDDAREPEGGGGVQAEALVYARVQVREHRGAELVRGGRGRRAGRAEVRVELALELGLGAGAAGEVVYDGAGRAAAGPVVRTQLV